jgi:hypothetical protein
VTSVSLLFAPQTKQVLTQKLRQRKATLKEAKLKESIWEFM